MARAGEPQVRKNGFRARTVRHPWTAERGRSLARRRCASCLTWGGACICLATFLPWVVARYEWGWWSWTGMQLTYAHFPPVTIGYVSLVFGGASLLLGRADARRPGHAELGILPASVTAFFLSFITSSLHGHLGEQIEATRGFSGAWLGPGCWLMMIGTALVLVGTVGATLSTRSDASLSLAAFEPTLPSGRVVTGDEQFTSPVHEPLEHSSVSR